jgi:ADP-ribose pyrophosphatase YjhB (NUDIX family)
MESKGLDVMERCNNTSVGVIVWREEKLLLIERAKPPYGWAPPAGHVDMGEFPEEAAKRGLLEETGLSAFQTSLVHTNTYLNKCRRPGGSYHMWNVFQAWVMGKERRSTSETKSLRWVTVEELCGLIALTYHHTENEATQAEWRIHPGLEPVWVLMLEAIERESGIAGRIWKGGAEKS